MKRILTALVALPILLYTVWTSFPYFFVAIASAAVILALREFYNLASRVGCRPQTLPGYIASLAVVAAFVWNQPAWIAAALGALAILALADTIRRPDDMDKALVSVSSTVFGVVYVAVLAGCLIGVRMLEDRADFPQVAPKLLTMFFALVMMTDTGAYYTGRSLGRHKLAPRVSPGKTIEGSVGGFVAATVTGLVCAYLFFPHLPLYHGAVLGATVGILAQVGDLAESLLKRGSGVKDSGNLLPGHGGMLDRVDSILFCAPLIYLYSRLFIPQA